VRKAALSAITPYLPEELLFEVVAQMESLDEVNRTDLIRQIVHSLPEPVLGSAFAAVCAVDDTDSRVNALIELTPRLASLPVTVLLSLWDRTLPLLSARSRASLLNDIGALSPVIHAISGPEGIERVFEAVARVSRWWP
jgi:hypothetical protein